MGDKTSGRPLTIELDADRAAWLRRKTASTGNAEARGLALVMLTRAIDDARVDEAYQDARADVRLAYEQGITGAIDTVKRIVANDEPDGALESATWRGYKDELHAQRIAHIAAFDTDRLAALKDAIHAAEERITRERDEGAEPLAIKAEKARLLRVAWSNYREAQRKLNAAFYTSAGEAERSAYDALQEAQALTATD